MGVCGNRCHKTTIRRMSDRTSGVAATEFVIWVETPASFNPPSLNHVPTAEDGTLKDAMPQDQLLEFLRGFVAFVAQYAARP
jgi:hypothetical protein